MPITAILYNANLKYGVLFMEPLAIVLLIVGGLLYGLLFSVVIGVSGKGN
jgi:hypothetical protein